MDSQIHIIRNQSVAGRTRISYRIHPAVPQTVLYQQTGLRMYPLARFTPVAPIEPDYKKCQRTHYHRIEQNKPGLIAVHQRNVQNDSPFFNTIHIYMEEVQLFVSRTITCHPGLLFRMKQATAPSEYLPPVCPQHKYLPPVLHHKHIKHRLSLPGFDWQYRSFQFQGKKGNPLRGDNNVLMGMIIVTNRCYERVEDFSLHSVP